MSKISQFKQIIFIDCSRYEDYTGWKTVVKRLLLHPCFRLLFLHRAINILELGGIFRIIYKWLSYKNMIEIPLEVELGPGFMMPHGGPVVVNAKAIIGSNCTMHPCSLIGGVCGKGVPRIGNNVFIGNGAKILGNVVIGDWVFICPNTVVVKSQEAGNVITGIPSRVLNDNGKRNCELYL